MFIMTKEKLFDDLKKAFIEQEEDIVTELCKKSLDMKINPEETIDQGLVSGMHEVGILFEEKEYFLPEVLICSDILNNGLSLLKPHLKRSETRRKTLRVVIGVVQGDTHDIGKNIVKIMMEVAGFEVHDLGKDVPLNKFIDKIEEIDGHLICMSTLMTTTMNGMKLVVDRMIELGIRDKYKVMIGGGPVSLNFAHKIGADYYSSNANGAVSLAKKMLETAV